MGVCIKSGLILGKMYGAGMKKTPCNELKVSSRVRLYLENGLKEYTFFFAFVRYTKPKGQLPDYAAPVVLKNGQSTVEDFCNSLHKSIMKEFKQ